MMKEREQINQHIVQLNDTVRDWFEEKNPDERKEFHLRRHLWYKHVIKTTEDFLRAVEECNKRCEIKKKEIEKKPSREKQKNKSGNCSKR